MGKLFACCSRKEVKKRPSKRYSNPPSAGAAAGFSNRWNRIRSSKKEERENSLTQEQVLAAALLFHQHQQNGSLSFDRSASLRYPVPGSKKQSLPRSSSSRSRLSTDPLLHPHQLVHQILPDDAFG